MKKILSFILGVALVAAMLPLVGVSAFDGYSEVHEIECGLWEDVVYMDALEMVCETGIMTGYTEDNFGSDYDLSRAAAAVIGSRLAMGVDEYDGKDEAGAYYEDIIDKLFTDTPPNETWNYWILKAMYYAYSEGIMSGDGDSSPTTFRPTEEVNTVEFFKIIFEAAKESEVINEDFDINISYSGDIWYSELIRLMYDAEVIYNYDIEDSLFISFYLYKENDFDGSYHIFNLDLDENLTRRNAAAIVHSMLMHDFIEM